MPYASKSDSTIASCPRRNESENHSNTSEFEPRRPTQQPQFNHNHAKLPLTP